MNRIVKAIGTIIVTIAILGLPVLTCLSFVLEWNFIFRVMLVVLVAIEAIFTYGEVCERSKDD